MYITTIVEDFVITNYYSGSFEEAVGLIVPYLPQDAIIPYDKEQITYEYNKDGHELSVYDIPGRRVATYYHDDTKLIALVEKLPV